jgi:hypothetical protein
MALRTKDSGRRVTKDVQYGQMRSEMATAFQEGSVACAATWIKQVVGVSKRCTSRLSFIYCIVVAKYLAI